MKAGFVQDRLHIVTESEAAAAFLADIHSVRPAQNFVILDAGGGTCDVAVRIRINHGLRLFKLIKHFSGLPGNSLLRYSNFSNT